LGANQPDNPDILLAGSRANLINVVKASFGKRPVEWLWAMLYANRHLKPIS
jgi:hypothetical protein